ncbi:hypothetical protein Q3G72_004175 [Acer saccharum]|nr:hypothetical protein Q3G72_011156 [Acer saccharum]KAK1581234.1 hypothetical protein Q3G72_004175 [Acer saccharum]
MVQDRKFGSNTPNWLCSAIGPSRLGYLCSFSCDVMVAGLLLWNQTRQRCWNATYDSLLGSNKPFPQPIPLPEMVDFLVDVWEQEGMYD